MATVRIALIAVLLAACEPLGDESYRGESLYSFQGEVKEFTELPDSDAPYRVSLFWSPTGSVDPVNGGLVEQAGVAVTLTFPLRFTLDVFDRPAAGTMLNDGRPFSVGLILAYQDRNYSGDFDQGELVGGSEDHVLIWTSRPLSAGESPTGRALERGYYLTRVPLVCPSQRRFSIPRTDCGVPLGKACKADAECGVGRCLDSIEGTPLPGGACALLDDFETNPNSCQPHGGGTLFEYGQRWFLGYCDADEDCRVGEGYSCERASNLCVPFEQPPVSIVLATDYYMDPLCPFDDGPVLEFDDDPFDP